MIRSYTFKFLAFLAIILVFLFLGKFLSFDLHYYKALLSRFPISISGVLFIALYVGLTTLVWFGPKDILRIASAILFGPYISTLFVSLAELMNAVILFKLSRKLGHDFVLQKFKLKDKDLSRMQKNKNILGTMALRINPFIPFRLQDIGAGLSRVDFVSYIVGIAVVSPLRIFWLQYILSDVGDNIGMLFYANMDIGNMVGDTNAVISFLKHHPFVQYLMNEPFILQYSFYYFGLVLLLSAIALIVKLFQTTIVKR